MKKFAVLVREVWIQVYVTEAETPEQAIKQVENGEVDVADGRIEFSNQLSSDTWTVEEEGKANEQKS